MYSAAVKQGSHCSLKAELLHKKSRARNYFSNELHRDSVRISRVIVKLLLQLSWLSQYCSDVLKMVQKYLKTLISFNQVLFWKDKYKIYSSLIFLSLNIEHCILFQVEVNMESR